MKYTNMLRMLSLQLSKSNVEPWTPILPAIKINQVLAEMKFSRKGGCAVPLQLCLFSKTTQNLTLRSLAWIVANISKATLLTVLNPAQNMVILISQVMMQTKHLDLQSRAKRSLNIKPKAVFQTRQGEPNFD